MPFYLGEWVNLRFTGDHDTARLELLGREYTVANGGLAPQRDGGLIAVLQLPSQPGAYTYLFTDDEGAHDSRKLRVIGEYRQTPDTFPEGRPVPAPPPPEPPQQPQPQAPASGYVELG
jgi:hypothetical protein